MSKITLDNLSDNLKAYLEGLGLSEEQVLNLINENGLDEEELKTMLKDTMSINELNTNSKTVIGAINELFQSANNGKELIANAIGEPVSADDTFSAMSTDINSLLSTFKTNMMNNGITVESGDKFKSLIDKIATMVEEGSGKGIQFAEGSGSWSFTLSNTTYSTTIETNLDFVPDIIFCKMDKIVCSGDPYIQLGTGLSIYDNIFTNLQPTKIYWCYSSSNYSFSQVSVNSISSSNFTVDIELIQKYVPTPGNITKWYAIGVGEEDTTLRDSLASILEEEGVSVTEEDDMASLISKVDSEFNEKNNEINGVRGKLYGLMSEGGYDVNSGMSLEDMLELLELSGISVSGIKQIACGGSHTIILKNDGSVWACGYNYSGSLGLGNTTNKSAFTQVTTNINNDVKQVACGGSYTFILKNDGTVWACGNNSRGQLGLGDTTNRTTFTQVTTNINNDVKEIVCGSYHTFILKNDGSVLSCGDNRLGCLGLGHNNNASTFTMVPNMNNVKQVACGYVGFDDSRENTGYTFILKNDGSLWACGSNYEWGQLGLGNNTDKNTFTQVTTNINNDVKQVACNSTHSIILKNDGSVWACGWNALGQLGLGNTSGGVNTFTRTYNVSNVKQIACSIGNSYILKNDGSVWSCGYNEYGEMGLGVFNEVEYTSFTQIPSNNENDSIICGESHVFVLKNDGSLWGWGYNTSGQLGTGNTTSQAGPVNIHVDSSF